MIGHKRALFFYLHLVDHLRTLFYRSLFLWLSPQRALYHPTNGSGIPDS
jgi:hypothetical protein